MKYSFLTPRAWLMCILLMGVSCFALINNPVFAQDAAAETSEVAAEDTADGEEAPKKAETKSVMDMFKAGGWAMYPLAVLSIAAFALIVYNFIAIKANRFLVPEALEKTNDALVHLHIDEARKICDENPAPATNILEAGLHRADINDWEPDMVKEAIEESTAEELSGAYIYINYLSVIGSLSPMLGLLGTVSGMVKAFNAIAAEGVGNPQLLADNISEALITTATGMIIGIPAMFFFFFFKNKYGKITSSVGRVIGDQLFNLNKAIKLAHQQYHAGEGHHDHETGHHEAHPEAGHEGHPESH